MQDFATPADMGAARRLRELDKSLTVGYPPSAPGTGGAYLKEDLSDLIPSLDYELTDAKLWTALFKQTVYSTVYQYDVIQSWGYQRPEARFQGEIARPRPDTAQVIRVAEQVATMGILGQVSDTAQRVHMNVDPVLQEIKTQTMALLKSINYLGYYGDKATAPMGFDGYRKRIFRDSPATNIIDLKGAPLTLDAVDQALAIVRDAPNYGQPSEIHLNPKVLAAFNRTYVPQGRFDFETDGTKGFNIAFDRFRSIVAQVKLVDTTFIQPGSTGQVSTLQNGTKAPQSPTPGTASVAAAQSGQTSRFFASDAGSYIYFVQATNADGASPLVQYNQSPINVPAGDIVSLPVTGGQGVPADAFTFFRLPMNATQGTPSEIGSVPNATGQGGQLQVTFNDSNLKRPNTTEGFVFDFRPETMFWASLCALEKQDLAKIQTADEFMLTIQGLTCLRAPGRLAMFINIGTPSYS